MDVSSTTDAVLQVGVLRTGRAVLWKLTLNRGLDRG
jgi:hypothetical protein